jgi:metal iron transporter
MQEATMNGTERTNMTNEALADDAKHIFVRETARPIDSASTIKVSQRDLDTSAGNAIELAAQPSGEIISPRDQTASNANGHARWRYLLRLRESLVKFSKFVGPGFLVSVAYIDPGNYATDVSAGAEFRFQLLFVILISSIIAVFLQCLCVRLGSVTGLNLAENCKAHLPKYVNLFFYVIAEGAIILTDVAEVRGI